MMAGSRPGPSLWWNVVGALLAALVVALVVIVGSPDPVADGTPVTTEPVGCVEASAICRLIDLLEEAEDNPDVTPEEREAIVEATAEVLTTTTIGGDGPRPAPVPSTSTTTTTTTTTTVPPLDQEEHEGSLLGGLLEAVVPTIPEGDGGEP